MHRILISLFVFACVQAPSPAQHFPPDAVLLGLLRAQVGQPAAGGIVLGLLNADGSTRVLTYGDAGPDALPLGPETTFEIGSVTKVFTGTLLAEAVGRGEISLTEPIETYLPEALHVPTRGGRHITALDLATHRSSLTGQEFLTGHEPGTPFRVDEMYDFLSGHELTRDIGSRFEYSNLGIDLLGDILDRVTDGDYEQTVSDRILTPLGMQRTGYTPTAAMLEHAAQLFDATGHLSPTVAFGGGPARSVRGSVGLTSNVEDLLAFLKANIDPPNSRLGEAMRMAQQARTRGGNEQAWSGLTWGLRLVEGGQQIVWKGGGVRGFVTYIGFDPRTRVGVVLLANAPRGGLRNLGHHLVNPSIPLRAGGASFE